MYLYILTDMAMWLQLEKKVNTSTSRHAWQTCNWANIDDSTAIPAFIFAHVLNHISTTTYNGSLENAMV